MANKKLSATDQLVSANVDANFKIVGLYGADPLNGIIPVSEFVEDTLTSTSVNKPLSAAKGKNLKDTADALASTVSSLSTVVGGKATTASVEALSTSKADKASPTFTGTVALPATTSIGPVSSASIGYLFDLNENVRGALYARPKSIAFSSVVTETPTYVEGDDGKVVYNSTSKMLEQGVATPGNPATGSWNDMGSTSVTNTLYTLVDDNLGLNRAYTASESEGLQSVFDKADKNATRLTGIPPFAGNTEALNGGLIVGRLYHTNGVVKIVI